MYPSSYARLWNPVRGIVFGQARQDEASHPRVDMLRSLHTTTPDNSQPAAATRTSDEIADSDSDDPPFYTAPEYQPVLGKVPTAQAPRADSGGAAKEGKVEAEVAATTAPAEPPLTSLDFKVPLPAFRKAQGAKENMAESFWSYTLYRGAPVDGAEQKVKVHYCKTKHTMERVCQYFVDDAVLGFDLEWFPDAKRSSGPKKNVSLIQIANEKRIALFHIALFPNDDFVAPTFRKIMEDSDLRKVGVNIKGDCTRIRNNLKVDTRGVFELSHLYKLVKYSASGEVELINKRLVPLATMVKEHLGLPMFKGQDVRSSDWSQSLNMDQLMYSASDAYAGFQLFHVLNEKRESLDPTPPLPYNAELGLSIRFADGVTLPTTDENAEAVDADQRNISAPLSASECQAIRDSLEVEADGEGQSIAESIRAAPAAPPRKRQKDARVVAADEKLASYRATIRYLRASPSAVRSYYIWKDNDNLTPEAVAKVLRDPPLQTNTVVSYILEALKLEKLPFDKKRLRDEILYTLPKEVLQGRYKALMLEANKPDTGGSSLAT
ncbi:3'-5' exonuclease [Colletotrichum orchidophilum]|uniref:3'-5' exonuclease n=1 Tax=Colletotrichum orchidophilum TaxID=1209926 RepID=A0A1G4B272_9PEZI|nr:3'-5' exonuclease [Colletotrichum orchidophilum]OHE95425.1 3'-5' exonuclease [Colletotrichum orchidophilum]